jgi:hypothetical protein
VTTTLRRLLLALCCATAAVALAPVRVVHACGQYSCLPVLQAVSPIQVVLDGKPVHLTLIGQNLATVSSVIVAPLVAPQGWTAYSDQTLLVTLPPNLPPGVYSVRVVSPDGASDPSMAPQFQVFPAAPPPPTPTAVVRATPAPKPTPVATPPLPETGAAGPAPTPSPSPGPPLADVGLVAAGGTGVSPSSAPVAIMAGLALGAAFFILWGNPRRLAGSWRTEPLRHLVGRPAQALHLGNICLYCGRLHLIVFTRRDLWRAGKYCRPRCFISAEATPSPLGDEDMEGDVPRRRARRRAV